MLAACRTAAHTRRGPVVQTAALAKELAALAKEFAPSANSGSSLRELGAYESMWLARGASFKAFATRFAADPTALPSDFVGPADAERCATEVLAKFRGAGVDQFGVHMAGGSGYPKKLRDAKYPVELLYSQGDWTLTTTQAVAVVGSRRASEIGRRRAAAVARELVRRNVTVVSGLAEGVDTAAHSSALHHGGRTIAFVGTPLDDCYPAANQSLQHRLARDHLLISQTPTLRYARQTSGQNARFFLERNVTMPVSSTPAPDLTLQPGASPTDEQFLPPLAFRSI
ncbi:MAG: DNA-processing protein DprA, partial [Proteobacteria bacterium]|nr:DNA-processing protein DprA [Pseudomonadota bacterium]